MQNYLSALWDLFVLLRTANNPDVTLPAVRYSPFYALFFVCFSLFTFFLAANILLAVIYNSYRNDMQKEVRGTAQQRCQKLDRVFDLLRQPAGVSRTSWAALLRLVRPKNSSKLNDVLFDVLREHRKTHIGRRQFLRAADLLNLSIREVRLQRPNCRTCDAKFYESRPSRILRRVVRHPFFGYAVAGIIIVNAACIALKCKF